MEKIDLTAIRSFLGVIEETLKSIDELELVKLRYHIRHDNLEFELIVIEKKVGSLTPIVTEFSAVAIKLFESENVCTTLDLKYNEDQSHRVSIRIYS